MGIEQKAKAYDEALKKARMYRDNAKAVEEYAAVARYENIFPELRESEDERIRKCLADCVSWFGEDSDFFAKHNLTKVQVLAYLKKQKEQKPTLVDKLRSVSTPAEENWFEIQKKWEKEDEQKPAEWSEEDEKMLNQILGDLEWARLKAIHIEDKNRIPYEKKSAWLKSLRPQPDKCNGCSQHLDGYISGRRDAENKLLADYGILIMPDHELRMKPRWNPSEEQMEALADAIEDMPEYYKPKCTLETLLHELNKLL
jgi:hypothetical protein